MIVRDAVCIELIVEKYEISGCYFLFLNFNPALISGRCTVGTQTGVVASVFRSPSRGVGRLSGEGRGQPLCGFE